MGFADAVHELRRHWQDLPELLDGDARDELTTLTHEALGARTDQRLYEAWHAVVDLVMSRLPADSHLRASVAAALDTHRLAEARANEEHRLPLPPVPAVAGSHRPDPPADRRPSIEDWILEAPAISEVSMRRRGRDPDQPGLIRLHKVDGRVSLPRFQFSPTGEPRRVVLRINEILGADTDPWGVADWWLCPNVWLAGTPVHLLDTRDEHLLVAAAVVAVEG